MLALSCKDEDEAEADDDEEDEFEDADEEATVFVDDDDDPTADDVEFDANSPLVNLARPLLGGLGVP